MYYDKGGFQTQSKIMLDHEDFKSHKKVHSRGRRVLTVFSRVIRKFNARMYVWQPLEPWILISVGPYLSTVLKYLHWIGTYLTPGL